MEHECELAERMEVLLFDAKSSDMSFIVEGQNLPVHRAIVASSSAYFRALLQGNMKESLQNEIVMEFASLRGFKLLMRYIYTGQLKLEDLDEETVLEVLGLVHMYGLQRLETILCEHIQKKLSLSNFCMIFNKAHVLALKDLLEICADFMLAEPTAILESTSFCELSEAAVCDMLSRDFFCAEEIKIFRAVSQWCAKQTSATNRSNVLRTVRLPLIQTMDLVTTVEDSGIFTADQLWDVIKKKKCQTAALNFRGFLKKDVNLASPDYGASKLITNEPGKIVDGKKIRYFESEPMPPSLSTFEIPKETGLTIAMNEPLFISHISFQLVSSCGYYIELSVDLKHWVRVIDHSEYTCRSFQDLFFESRAARYIRLTTTRAGKAVEISELVVNYFTGAFRLSCGFHAPREDVAPKAKIVGDDEDESGWISHEIGGGEIRVHFPQPYTVDSIRMLLRSDESRAYLYFVETSMDEENWKRVVENTVELCRGQQKMTFEPHPVLFIRIVGTASTVGELFSLSKFECPAQEEDHAECENRQSETKEGASKDS